MAKLHHFGNIGQFCMNLFSGWQNFEPTLAILLCEWGNLHSRKGPNIEQIIRPSGHTGKKSSKF